MSEKAFVDTNILVYAHDRGAGERHQLAKGLIRRLWNDRNGVLSTQVLQEFYVNLRRKALSPLSRSEAEIILHDYLAWEIQVNDGDSICEAARLEERYQLSFWDALIVHAAIASGATTLYSEDLNAGQIFGSVRVVNPLVRD